MTLNDRVLLICIESRRLTPITTRDINFHFHGALLPLIRHGDKCAV